MDAYDANLLARILLTLATVGYGFVTIKADFNRTHATNPAWTPHARFHVVWQISSYCGFALLALALIWLRGPMYVERLYLAGAFAGVVYGAFYVALLAMPLYGGRTFDDNGYLPFRVPLAGRWDVNVTAFSVLLLILVGGIVSVAHAGVGG